MGRALHDVGTSSLTGGLGHLRLAVVELTNGDFADSARESIHSIESVVRVLEPSGDFSKALNKLEQKTNIHGALKKGFVAIYGFCNALNDLHPIARKFVNLVSITGDLAEAAEAASLRREQVAAILPALKVKLGPLLRLGR